MNCDYATFDWYCDQQVGHAGPHGMFVSLDTRTAVDEHEEGGGGQK